MAKVSGHNASILQQHCIRSLVSPTYVNTMQSKMSNGFRRVSAGKGGGGSVGGRGTESLAFQVALCTEQSVTKLARDTRALCLSEQREYAEHTGTKARSSTQELGGMHGWTS